jgi:hypothetical protein
MYRKNSILESVRKNLPPVDKNRGLETALLTLPLKETALSPKDNTKDNMRDVDEIYES